MLALLMDLLWPGPLVAQSAEPSVTALGTGFASSIAEVNATTLHYVRGGTGPAVILLHGFPQDWFVFHKIMPRLAKRYTVIAVDLRGIGGSAPAAGGYEAANTLFERTNGGTRPTIEGQEFLDAARRIVEETEAITARLKLAHEARAVD
jgi:pimeloyl-ACP methyl ester carboxylesterase